MRKLFICFVSLLLISGCIVAMAENESFPAPAVTIGTYSVPDKSDLTTVDSLYVHCDQVYEGAIIYLYNETTSTSDDRGTHNWGSDSYHLGYLDAGVWTLGYSLCLNGVWSEAGFLSFTVEQSDQLTPPDIDAPTEVLLGEDFYFRFTRYDARAELNRMSISPVTNEYVDENGTRRITYGAAFYSRNFSPDSDYSNLAEWMDDITPGRYILHFWSTAGAYRSSSKIGRIITVSEAERPDPPASLSINPGNPMPDQDVTFTLDQSYNYILMIVTRYDENGSWASRESFEASDTDSLTWTIGGAGSYTAEAHVWGGDGVWSLPTSISFTVGLGKLATPELTDMPARISYGSEQGFRINCDPHCEKIWFDIYSENGTYVGNFWNGNDENENDMALHLIPFLEYYHALPGNYTLYVCSTADNYEQSSWASYPFEYYEDEVLPAGPSSIQIDPETPEVGQEVTFILDQVYDSFRLTVQQRFDDGGFSTGLREIQHNTDRQTLTFNTAGNYTVKASVQSGGLWSEPAVISFTVLEDGTLAADFKLPADLTSIEDEAFLGVPATIFDLPDHITDIGNNAFPDGAILLVKEGSATEAAVSDSGYQVVTK